MFTAARSRQPSVQGSDLSNARRAHGILAVVRPL
jgi:hypothetical protein